VPDPRSAPAVTVVVATRNRPDQLRGALAAIAASVGSRTDVLVVDSAGDTEASRAVADEAGARYVRSDRPGLSVARNLGVASTDAEVVAFTDDDCRPRSGWLAPLVTPFEEARVGFVTGQVVGSGEGTAADVPDLGAPRWRWPDDPAHMGSGANMAVRRAAVLQVGGFDARLGAGAPIPSAEDHDLFLRALHAGWEGRHAAGSVVDHLDERTRWETVRLCYRYGVGAGVLCGRARALDPVVARRMLRARLWHDGVRSVVADLRRGWEVPALRGAAMTLGVVAGRVRAGRRTTTGDVDAGPRPQPRNS
jgi:GT2 family glycosyltransferase